MKRKLEWNSFAAPFVAGVAALLLSKYPSLTPREIAETLYEQAEDLARTVGINIMDGG